MRAFIMRRLLAVIPTILIATLIAFFAIRLLPGNILDLMISQEGMGSNLEEKREVLNKKLGLDAPIYVQYIKWMKQLCLHGDLGNSLWSGEPVTKKLLQRFPVTFEISFLALTIAILISLPIGIYSAVKMDTIKDYLFRTIAIVGIAIPAFWLGTLILVYPATWWNWSPPIEFLSFNKDPVANLKIVLLPALIMGFGLSAVTMRMTRAMMLEVLRQDYIRTARAKGLKERKVVLGHALKNALIPVITLIGLFAPFLIGGAVVMESIFSIPGMGLLILESILQRDYPIVVGVMLFTGFLVLVVNLLVDISYAYLDPKIRYR